MSERPHIDNAPGLTWKTRKNGWEARWQARTDILAMDYPVKSARIWAGAEPTDDERTYIAARCQRLQDEMLAFAQVQRRKSAPTISTSFNGTLTGLIYAYQTDKDSTYQKLRYRSRMIQDAVLLRIARAYGEVLVAEIRARVLIGWHSDWRGDSKIAMAHAFIGHLRTLFGFGATIMEDPECERLCGVLHRMKFPMSKPRGERLTAEQVIALRTTARRHGFASMALAQAIQFELMLRQKDVIGEWVPQKEDGTSDVLRGNDKWLRGIRWSEIDGNLILRHITSKRQKPIEVDLKLAGMVVEELGWWLVDQKIFENAALALPLKRSDFPSAGPVIVSETTGYPWTDHEYRRNWRKIARAAGIPDAVKNMDSRAGGISEATDAGASLEMVRHAATHSNVSTTANYSRGSTEKTAEVLKLRAAHRNEGGTNERRIKTTDG